MNAKTTAQPRFFQYRVSGETLKCFIAILLTYLLLYTPIIIVGRPMYEDMVRGTSGDLGWSISGRPLADLLFAFLNLGVPSTTVYVFNQLLAVVFLSLAALIATS